MKQHRKQPAVTLAGLGNEALKPERSQEFETGFDAGFVHSRANVQVTYYNKRTTDALIQRVLPGSLGATVSRIENVGVVTNTGVEVSFNGRLIDLSNAAFDLNVEVSRNKNKLVDLGGMLMGGTPADFGKVVVEETEKWAKVVKFSGAKAD